MEAGFLKSSLNGLKTLEPFGRLKRFGFEFSLSKIGSLRVKSLEGGRGEKRKLSVSRPAMSSQELMTSGSERRVLGSESGLGKTEPRVKREGGVVEEEEEWGGSRVRRP